MFPWIKQYVALKAMSMRYYVLMATKLGEGRIEEMYDTRRINWWGTCMWDKI